MRVDCGGSGGWKPQLYKRCPPDADEEGIWRWKIVGWNLQPAWHGFGFCRRGLNRRVSLNQLDGIFNPLGMGLVFV
ncbi:hypothetical protein, partial [Microcoleus sp. CAWBG556]|uniref:hypothetical protein n=1 Tax=Microcoleus sp. CAWBG556 TaxID=2841650 RepID=UPI0025F4D1E7